MNRLYNFVKPKSYKGQVLLIVVLVMLVAVTVGLSIISRSITNIRTSTQQAESQKALSAAEAGVEQTVKSQAAISAGQLSSSNVTYDTSITQQQGTDVLLMCGNPIHQDESADVWLINHNSDGSLVFNSGWQQVSGNQTLTFYWGLTGDSCSGTTSAPAIEITAITDAGGNHADSVITRSAVDPCSGSGGSRSSNNFQTPNNYGPSNPFPENFLYKDQITIPSGSGLVVSVTPLYNSTPVGVVASASLPSQGSEINSTGKAGTTTREVNYCQAYPQLPPEFSLYGIFSPS